MRTNSAKSDYPGTFEVLGFLSIVAGILCVVVFFANAKTKHNGGHDISDIIYFSFFFIPVGAGLIFKWRIAAVLLSLPLGVVAVWMVVGSIVSVPFPWLLLNIFFGAL